LRGLLKSPALAEDLERLTGLPLERRAEGVALINAGGRLTDVTFPGTGTVAQAALLLCARIAGYLQRNRHRVQHLPVAPAAERLADAAPRIAAALPARTGVTALLEDTAFLTDTALPVGPALAEPEAAYPFLSESWLRAELMKLVDEFGRGMSERQ